VICLFKIIKNINTVGSLKKAMANKFKKMKIQLKVTETAFKAAGLNYFFKIEEDEKQEYPAINIYANERDMKTDCYSFQLAQINEEGEWIYLWESIDAGVRYHPDGSGTPPSSEMIESDIFQNFGKALVALILFIVENNVNDSLEHFYEY
jgi:hypothetical protein